MEHFIKNLSIKNFKSIQSLDIETERINLFIGKPNVGKSNILEAISLFGLVNAFNSGVEFSEFIRFNILNNLFYDATKPVIVKTDLAQANLTFYRKMNNFMLGVFDGDSSMNKRNKYEGNPSDYFLQNPNDFDKKDYEVIGNYDIIEFNKSGDFKSRSLSYNSDVKKYQFKEEVKLSHNSESISLATPFGNNLFEIIQSSKNLRKQIASYFKEYGLDFLLDIEDRKFEIQKVVDGISYKTPYRLIADTLQRMIFHVAAIESNRDSVLLFEEPENHSFPPYIRELALRIIESETNQFFITTHSPYLLNTIIEQGKDQVAVFVTSFTDHETKIKRLSKDEIARVLNYGIDIFFNLNQFIND